jgi:6-phosphogluconolactonase
MKRRNFLQGVIAAGVAAGQEPGSAGRVYFGTFTRGISKGIYTAAFNAKTGELSVPALAVEARNASFLVVHGRTLYAVSEVGDFEGNRSGALMAYRMRPDHSLEPLNGVASGGMGPCHLAVDRQRRRILVAHYLSGSFASFRVRKDGSIEERASLIQHEGKGANPRRQEGPHAHSADFSADGKWAYCCDLGIDEVRAYAIGPDARLTPAPDRTLRAAPGSGPRHLSKRGRFTYVLNELSSTVDVFPAPGQPVQTLSTLPADFTGTNTTAEIAIHPGGRFLYASNRGHDSLAAFAIGVDGLLRLLGTTPCGGKVPRSFAIDPSGRWLICAHQNSDSAQVFAVEPGTGALAAQGAPVTVGAPVCVQFTA